MCCNEGVFVKNAFFVLLAAAMSVCGGFPVLANDAPSMFGADAARTGIYTEDETTEGETGSTWRFQTESSRSAGSPIVANGVVYAGAGDGRLYAIDLESEEVLWTSEPADWVLSSPV